MSETTVRDLAAAMVKRLAETLSPETLCNWQTFGPGGPLQGPVDVCVTCGSLKRNICLKNGAPDDLDYAQDVEDIKNLTLLHEETVIRPAAMSYVKPSEYRQRAEGLLDQMLESLRALREEGTPAVGIANIYGHVAPKCFTGSDAMYHAQKYADEVNAREHATGKPWGITYVLIRPVSDTLVDGTRAYTMQDELNALATRLSQNVTSLDPEAAKVLYDNLWELYVPSTKTEEPTRCADVVGCDGKCCARPAPAQWQWEVEDGRWENCDYSWTEAMRETGMDKRHAIRALYTCPAAAPVPETRPAVAPEPQRRVVPERGEDVARWQLARMAMLEIIDILDNCAGVDGLNATENDTWEEFRASGMLKAFDSLRIVMASEDSRADALASRPTASGEG